MMSVGSISETPRAGGMTYARARLWLGISCVGTVVTVSAIALAIGLPSRLLPTDASSPGATVGLLAALVAVYVLLQVPFDVLGGHVLPRRFGRMHRSDGGSGWVAWAAAWLRGVLVHAFVLLLALIGLHYAAVLGGVVGLVIGSAGGAIALLAVRVPLAAFVSGIKRTDQRLGDGAEGMGSVVLSSADEGFTGGFRGVFRPRGLLVPVRWKQMLSDDGVRGMVRLRELAVSSGSWRRGRVVSLIFLVSGAGIAGGLTGYTLGFELLGTVAGTATFCLWYTLWSFVGLLVLPSPSRAATHAADRSLRAELHDERHISSYNDALRTIDRLADGERSRPVGIETIFHPIPSLDRRTGDADGVDGGSAGVGLWDVARTSIFTGLAGGSLLTRSVHCNCGRPDLWVFLPSP